MCASRSHRRFFDSFCCALAATPLIKNRYIYCSVAVSELCFSAKFHFSLFIYCEIVFFQQFLLPRALRHSTFYLFLIFLYVDNRNGFLIVIGFSISIYFNNKSETGTVKGYRMNIVKNIDWAQSRKKIKLKIFLRFCWMEILSSLGGILIKF